jgi:hypothetical protein
MTQPQTRMVTGFQPFLGQIVKKIAEMRRLRRCALAPRDLLYIYLFFYELSKKNDNLTQNVCNPHGCAVCSGSCPKKT